MIPALRDYAVTVTGGTATVAAGTPITRAMEGVEVTVTADAPETGKVFDKWVVLEGNVTLANANSETTTFTMPARAVSVKATYKDKPVTTYTVSFNANGGSVTPASAETNAEGKLATLPTPTRSGYRFNGWYTAKIGGTAITNNTVFTADTTVYAHWTKKPTGGSSGSGSTPAKNPVQSVDTGDMGIALYAGMALLSLTGGAWVVNKKRKGK